VRWNPPRVNGGSFFKKTICSKIDSLKINIDPLKADASVLDALKKCHKSDVPLTCVKKIPQLATCFA
jgi:hypothetical protein